MRKVVLLASFCIATSFAFAQKDVVKKASKLKDKTEEARATLAPALSDAETKDQADTWKLAGDIEYAAYEKQREAEMTKEFTKGPGWDESIMYPALYNMAGYYLKADQLGELPDAKGKVKNKVRKDIQDKFRNAILFYVYGGDFYNRQANLAAEKDDVEGMKTNYAKAADFFNLYWDIQEYPMFKDEKEPLVPNDSTNLIYKYYGIIFAVQSGDTGKSIPMIKRMMNEPYQQNATFKESDLYELLASEYQKSNDSVAYVQALELGASKFPANQFLTSSLINEYLKANKTTEAIAYLDQAYKNDPSSKCELMSIKAGLIGGESAKYDEAITIYKDILATNPDCERALDGLGTILILKAQDLSNDAGQEGNAKKRKELDAESIKFYEASLPHLEKCKALMQARNVDKYDLRPILGKLQNAYYNLTLKNVDKSKELDAIEKEMND